MAAGRGGGYTGTEGKEKEKEGREENNEGNGEQRKARCAPTKILESRRQCSFQCSIITLNVSPA